MQKTVALLSCLFVQLLLSAQQPLNKIVFVSAKGIPVVDVVVQIGSGTCIRTTDETGTIYTQGFPDSIRTLTASMIGFEVMVIRLDTLAVCKGVAVVEL